ncbi:MAG: outer membrane protein assembly factor BamA [Candidatus Omnitrophota bacterium]
MIAIKKARAVFLFGITVLIASFCFNLPLSAQGTAKVEKLITAIEIEGNRSIGNIAVLSKMKSRVGSAYSENIINDDLKRLYLLGYFSDIDIKTEDYKDGIKIIINVVERPIIEKINFTGFRNLRVKEDKLRESVKSRQGQYLDYPALNEDSLTLKKMYIKKGFPESGIEYKVDIAQETNKAVVKFIAKEARRIKIKKIYIEGNTHFSDSRILKIIKTKRAWLLGGGIFKKDVLEEDMQRIISFYQKEGFSDVEASYEIEEHPRKPFLYITVSIVEGKQYFAGSIHLIGNSVVNEREIRSALLFCPPGKVYYSDGINQDKVIIQGLYFDRGYIMSDVSATTVLNPETGAIDITYHIIENEVSYVNKIKIRGNIKTKDVVIRRELRIHPGDRFDGEKLRRSKERLANLGFFEEVSFDTQTSAIANQPDLIVEVKETKTGTFSFGGGYSTIDGFIGFIEIAQRNFDWKNFPYFTGDGQDLKLRTEMGTVSENLNLSFTEPWLFDYPVSFGFDVYRLTHDRESDIGWGYDESKTGGDIRLGKEITEYIKGNIAYRFDKIEISNVDLTSKELQNEKGNHNVSSLELGMSFDNRDNVFNPTKGILLTGNFDIAGGALGGNKDFFRFSSRGSKYFPLFRGSVLEFRAQAGLADSYGDTNNLPIYGRFFTGGAYSVRGYEERMIGPIDSLSNDPIGGNSLLVGNIEYSYPLLDFLRVGCFYDVGNVWGKLSDIGGGGFKSGVGLGVRIKTPIGPLRLDYGIPLNKQAGEDEKKTGRVHFSMGGGF